MHKNLIKTKTQNRLKSYANSVTIPTGNRV